MHVDWCIHSKVWPDILNQTKDIPTGNSAFSLLGVCPTEILRQAYKEIC